MEGDITYTVGIEKFTQCLNRMKKEGKWYSWRNYYFPHYQNVFSAMLHIFWRKNVDEARDMVEAMDFDRFLVNANKFIKDKGMNKTRELLASCRNSCDADNDFDVYFLIGFGSIDGTSLPLEEGPVLYFGLEMYRSLEQLEYFVPHEYNHLVRMTALPEVFEEITTVKCKQLTIMEGLGTLFPLLLKGKEITPLSVVEAGMMPKDVGEYCYKNEKEYMKKWVRYGRIL